MSEKKNPVWLDSVAILVAILVCGTMVGFVEGIGHRIYPPPQEVVDNPFSEEGKAALEKYIETAPTMALLFPIVAHGIGCLCGGFIVSLFQRKFWLLGVLIVGILFTGIGFVVMFMVPHPMWFKVVDLMVYLPSAFAGGFLCNLIFRGAGSSAGTDDDIAKTAE